MNMPPLPDVSLNLEIGEPMARFLDDPLRASLRDAITEGLSELLNTLGIPGRPLVQISSTPSSPSWMRLHINGQVCRYPEELLLQAYSYISEQWLHRGLDLDHVRQWVLDTRDNPSKLVAFIRLVCLEAISQQPEILLGDAQVVALVDLWQSVRETLENFTPVSTSVLQSILKDVLRLRISLADASTVARVLSNGLARTDRPEEIAESLIEALRPKTLEIQLSEDYMRQITAVDTDSGYFNLMRDGLFYEMGLEYPNFEFVFVDTLKPNGIAFKINHLTTLPRLGLPAKQVLVGSSSTELARLGIEARTGLNPANGNEASQINLEDQPRVPGAWTTWKAMGYLILCLNAELRAYGECFVDRPFVRRQFDRLHDVFPALVETVRVELRDEQAVRLLRYLAAEQISIRDLGQILNAVLDYDFVVTDPLSLIIFDDRLGTDRPPDAMWLEKIANLSSFVRTCLKRYISYKYARGSSTLAVYLLDPEQERLLYQRGVIERLADNELLLEEELDRFLEAVRLEASSSPVDGNSPAILTMAEVRPFVRKLIAKEFPKIPVLAYQELSPHMNFQPVARITP